MLARRLPSAPRTRFAPSPTGYLHLGHVVNAVYVWGLAAQLGGQVLLRLETHDRIRSRPSYSQAALDDLEWLGFVPNEGPVDQSDDGPYAAALANLSSAGLVYACRCTRKILAGSRAGAPEIYDGRCRDLGLNDAPEHSLRLRVASTDMRLTDGRREDRHLNPYELSGDIILRDRNRHWSYHLAVTVDDLRQDVDIVVRGADLVDTTWGQVQLGQVLGRPRPAVYVHHPLILRPGGRKVSKSDGDTGVRDLRTGGASPAQVIGLAAHAAGLIPAPRSVTAAEVPSLFDMRAPRAQGDVLG
jgi:glutamyl-Q tRNA(Asp) synthetase